jgi:hypothetical protein
MAVFTRKRYYFAFGSNMHLDQMSTRCPGSIYEGTAVLHGWRWQINSRGVANIVQQHQPTNEVVEGLVFSVTEDNERALDRYEGVKRGLYERLDVWLQFKPVFPTETQFLASELQSPQGVSARVLSLGLEVHIQAFAYISRVIEDGSIREEYVARMEHAVKDALSLGISPGFAHEPLMRVIHGPIMESISSGQHRRQVLRNPQKAAAPRESYDRPGAVIPSAEHRRRSDTEPAYADSHHADSKQQHQVQRAHSPQQRIEQKALSTDSIDRKNKPGSSPPEPLQKNPQAENQKAAHSWSRKIPRTKTRKVRRSRLI